MNPTTRNVRELGGEIWGELVIRARDPQHPLAAMDFQCLSPIIDVVMGVLARHDGTVIVNDDDLPVAPLPKKIFT